MMIPISIAAFFLVSLAVLVAQRLRLQRFMLSELATSSAGADDPAAVPELDNALFHTRVGRKIFSAEDLALLKAYPAEIRKRYLLRKRAVALQWLSEGRRRMHRVMRLHRHAARVHSALEPREEFSLMANYVIFLAMCSLAETLTLLVGPIVLGRLAERASHSRQIVFALLWKSAGAQPAMATRA